MHFMTTNTNLEINRLSAAKHSMSFYTSLMRAGGRIASIVLIFSGFASIPPCETKKPSSLLIVTLKTHFSGFSFVRVEHNLSRTKSRLSNRDAHDFILTMMSSTYTSTKSLMRALNVLRVAHKKVGRATIRHGDITKDAIYAWHTRALHLLWALVFDGNQNKHLGSIVDHSQR
jgi:hypothetical protein